MMNENKKQLVLVLINPHSGRGKSVAIFKKIILPFFESNNIEHQVFITEKNLRINEFMREKLTPNELYSFKSIIVVSGDGLMFETINTLMKFDDSTRKLPPVGIIPTGSGNGLAYTLLRQNTQNELNNYNDIDAVINFCCKQAIQDKVLYSDLIKLTFDNENKEQVFSFLSIGWGLLADIDIDSEWLRRLGELRFTIYGLLRSVTAKTYQGKLSFKKHIIPNEETSTESDNCWTHIEDKFACLYAVHQTYISRLTKFAPESTLVDQIIYLTFVRGNLTPCQAVEFMLAVQDGSHNKLAYVTVVPVTTFRFKPLEESRVVVDGEVISWSPSDGFITADIMPKALKLLWDPEI